MKKTNSIILHLPTSFIKKLDEYLVENPPNFKYNTENFYYVYHTLTVNTNMHKKREFVSLNKAELKKIAASNIHRYIKLLKDGGFIISDNEFIKYKKPFFYKLNPEYLDGNYTDVILSPDSKIFKKIIKNQYRKRAHDNRLKPFLKVMLKAFKKIEFDFYGAEKWILKNGDKSKVHTYLTSITQIKDSRFRHFKRNTTNFRLDTNFTNLKKELRQFIKGDFISIDLKNSQPFFLSQLTHKLTHPRMDTICCNLSNDRLSEAFGRVSLRKIVEFHQKSFLPNLVNLKLFADSVLGGTLYDDFISMYNEKSLVRKDIKDIMFKVLFSRNHINNCFIPYKNEKKVFASQYPFIYGIIEILKSKDHASLAIYLQKLESYIFIDCIAKDFVEAGIIPLTIHDSVIVETKDQDKALEIIHKVFLDNFGVIPAFEVESLKEQKNNSNQQIIKLR